MLDRLHTELLSILPYPGKEQRSQQKRLFGLGKSTIVTGIFGGILQVCFFIVFLLLFNPFLRLLPLERGHLFGVWKRVAQTRPIPGPVAGPA